MLPLLLAQSQDPAPTPEVAPVSDELRASRGLDPFYVKHVDVAGFPILGSERVSDAALREANARLTRASRDLARTELTAPFRGRVRTKDVDVGQFVNRGAVIGVLYAVDWAEVRLPLPDRELRWLDLPLGYADGPAAEDHLARPGAYGHDGGLVHHDPPVLHEDERVRRPEVDPHVD